MNRALLASALLSTVSSTACSGPPGGAGADAAAGHDWRAVAPIGVGPRLEAGVVALDGRVYVLGGFDPDVNVVADVAVYDPATDTWSVRAPMPRGLHHLNVATAGGKIWVVGGLTLTGSEFTAVADAFSYDPVTDAWTTLTPMPVGTERGAAAVAALGDIIYVVGGSRADALAEVSAYHADSDTWEALPPLAEPQYHAVAAVVDGTLYVVGGLSAGIAAGTSVPLTDVLALDPTTGTFTPRAALPTPRGGCAAGVIAGRIVCAGGEGDLDVNGGVATVTEVYDPAADSWTAAEPMLTPRAGTGGAVVDDVLYVPGGAWRLVYVPLAVTEAFAPSPDAGL